jgi:REP element-mobilizing transposase RayT
MYAHITWHTWQRAGCVDTAAVADIRSALVSAAKKTSIRVLRHAELADHLHLIVSFRPDHRVSDFVRLAKSVSSTRAGRRVPGAIKWARGYYVTTFHPKDLGEVAAYVARQFERHPDRMPRPSRRT